MQSITITVEEPKKRLIRMLAAKLGHPSVSAYFVARADEDIALYLTADEISPPEQHVPFAQGGAEPQRRRAKS